MQRNVLIVLLIVLIVGAASFYLVSQSKQTSQNSKLQVTTSFYPLYYFVSQIGGDKVAVTNITPAGTEPHDYEPTAMDIAKISSSRLLVLNGGIEAWGDRIKDNLQGKNVTIVVAGSDLLNQQLTDEQGKVNQDPHVWLSPELAKIETEKIAQALEKIDPANAQYYQTNEANLAARLDQLDLAFKQGLNHCQQKDIITSHAAFGYLAKAYNLNQISIAGLSPDAEPSSKQLANLVTFAKEHHTKYIFFESLVSPKLAETLASEVGAKTLVLDPLEGLSDNDIKAGKDYFTIMDENLKNLQLALEC